MEHIIGDLQDAGWTDSIIHEYVVKKKRGFKAVPIVQVNKITRRFSKEPLLKKISFSVYQGEIFGIIGRSGVGKTTLLNIIAGIDQPNFGTVKIANHTRVGFSTQYPSFYEDLTVLENCRYFMNLAGIPKKSVRVILEGLALMPYYNLLAKDLSGGLKKKLDIALALIGDPDLILLDEPTADLDPVSRRNLWKFLEDLHKKGKTIIVASHLLGEVEPFCSRVAIINNAEILDIGTPDHFQETIGSRYVLKLEVESGDYSSFIPHVKEYWKDGNALMVSFQKQEDIFAFLKLVLNSHENISRISVEHPSLDNVFCRLVS